MIDAAKVALFIPPGLKKFKLNLFESIGRKIGKVVRDDPKKLDDLPADVVPVVGCSPFLKPWYDKWKATGRDFIYWDRGYLRRVFATWLPKGSDMGIPGGYYRWHLNAFQMKSVDSVPADRWNDLKLNLSVKPWNKNGSHIVIADTLPDYWNLFCDPHWCRRIAADLKQFTDRPIIIRHKESKVPLEQELKGAHCLVAHGSIAAVESVVMGCPVFVSEISAARFVGKTDFSEIEQPIYPDREKWLHSLAYCQFNESELVDGTLWRLIK